MSASEYDIHARAILGGALIVSYKRLIAHADKAKVLHDLHAEIGGSEQLTSDEKTELCELVRVKFCRINQAAVGTKPRW